MKKKRMLSVVTSATILGGAELNLAHILNAASEYGYQVILIVWNIDNSPINHWSKYPQFNIYEIKTKGVIGLIKLMRLLFLVSKASVIDLSYISNITLSSIIGLSRRLSLYRTDLLIVRDPSSPFLRYSNYLKVLMYKIKYYLGYPGVDYLIFQTSLIQKAFYANINLNIRSKVLANPIDLDSVKNRSLMFDVNSNRLFIVACGRLIYEKGFDLLIQAYYEARLFEKYDLFILGSGPLESHLKALVENLKIDQYVIFKGFVDNPMPYFREASICVISSRSEGFPNILYQMLALNNKVIMTKCCGDLSNIPGIKLIDNDSAQALKDALIFFDNNLLKEGHVVADYLKDRSVKKYIETFFNIILHAK